MAFPGQSDTKMQWPEVPALPLLSSLCMAMVRKSSALGKEVGRRSEGNGDAGGPFPAVKFPIKDIQFSESGEGTRFLHGARLSPLSRNIKARLLLYVRASPLFYESRITLKKPSNRHEVKRNRCNRKTAKQMLMTTLFNELEPTRKYGITEDCTSLNRVLFSANRKCLHKSLYKKDCFKAAPFSMFSFR
uniref:Uncharacterized protein IDI2-AS1 n=1 Tax=Homo sapiens TaxID=9606 RepID=IDAS1_HUMAN|nr:RecName: Full=Uncharacterized protein IDI2-AS1; AltName: Full=IDI2 antisense RNA 1; AltName: Full=IDI2 antisense gene protein 1 [Homo sapiens]AAF67648.1 uncharacterized hypothalamus protein HT009 [Homo sapiens]